MAAGDGKERDVDLIRIGVISDTHGRFDPALPELFAGVAGSFYAAYFAYISPLVFTFEYSVSMLVFIVVGGFASIAARRLASASRSCGSFCSARW